MDLFSQVIFLTFRVDLISRIGYWWIFRESQFYQCFIYFDFFVICFQLNVSHGTLTLVFRYFKQHHLDINSLLNAQEIKRSRYKKKIHILLSILSLLILFDIMQNIFDMTIKTKHYIRTGFFTFLICSSSLKPTVLSFIQILRKVL